MPDKRIAYFSMEIGLESTIPTYSGGLGILAGDTIRSAADHGLPLVAVTLLYRHGFAQKLDDLGRQKEVPTRWTVEDYLIPLDARATVEIEGRPVSLACWKKEVTGVHGDCVPVYFLDADVRENDESDRGLTHHLYGGDDRYRLAQEVILGIGGVHMLQTLGHDRLERFHMNEGHSSLLTLALLGQQLQAHGAKFVGEPEIEAVRERCIFTTHTPVADGHDQFAPDLARSILGDASYDRLAPFAQVNGKMDMTYTALNMSRLVNGVARKHAEVSRSMFEGYLIDSITNGVHAGTWTCAPMRELFDQHITGWRETNNSLRYASAIPLEEIWNAHHEAKKKLLERVNTSRAAPPVAFEPDVFTIGFARRATAYKRADLLFHSVRRLEQIAGDVGPIQLVYAGRAHPKDHEGKEVIQRIFEAKKQLGSDVQLFYLENYDFDLGRLLTSGVDLWLNTPQAPLEASGTSGMKAALNGVPSLSILDGWWIEGHLEGITGWSIETDEVAHTEQDARPRDAEALYQKLETKILPLYYRQRESYIETMRHAIALNGSFFNTDRMVGEYLRKAYLPLSR